MTETERNQIKGALLKCAEENENKSTLTGHIVVSSLCKSAVERIEELEKENAELKEQVENRNCSNCRRNKTGCPNDGSCHNFSLWQPFINPELTKAKEIIKDYMIIAKGAHITECGVSEENRTIYVLKLNKEAEEFLDSEVEE